MTIKKAILLMIGVVLAFTIVSCGETTEVNGNGEIYVEQEWDVNENTHLVDAPIEINFWSANSAVDIQGSSMADLVQMFNDYQLETYPDSAIKVRPSFQGGYNNQNSKLQASLIGNTNPEIAMVGVSSMALYVDNAVDMRNIFTYEEIENIFEGFLQFAMYQHKFVAYPYFAATNVNVVNRTLLEQTGLHIPTVDEIIADPENSIWTWDYFEEVLTEARKLKTDETDIYGWATGGIPLYESFYTQGVSIYNETATEINFNSDFGLEALTYWQNLAKADLYKNPVLDPNHGTRIQGEFSSGKVGMLWSTSSIIKSLIQNIYENPMASGQDPLFELDVLPHPKQSNFYSNQSGGGLIVFNNKSDERTNAAAEFLRWLQADEQSVYFSTHTGYLVTTKTAVETQAWKDFANINPVMDNVIKLMIFNAPDGTRIPIGRAKALADDDFGKYSKGIFYDDFLRTPADVLQDCVNRISYILETNS
ncbi:extracellular solute-binding protein [Mycoplasmatota bacterium WC30]